MVPDVIEKSIMGGNHIFKVNGQSSFNKFYRNVIQVMNDENGEL